MQREVIFDMPKTHGDYRMVCRFGYDHMINFAWWGHLQKKVVKKPFFWGKPKEVWKNIDQCWWSGEITSIEQLKHNATKFYDTNVEMPMRIIGRAMSI